MSTEQERCNCGTHTKAACEFAGACKPSPSFIGVQDAATGKITYCHEATPAAPVVAEGLTDNVVAYLYEWDKGSTIFTGKTPLDHSSEEYFDLIPQGATETALVRLAAHPVAPPVVAEGWRFVPVEPTTEMLVAGQRSGVNSAWSYDNCYRAMLAAAPAHPVAGSPAEAEKATLGDVWASGGVHWDLFPGYLIDHREGDILTEEGLQFALAAMLKDEDYLRVVSERAAAEPMPASEAQTCPNGCTSPEDGGAGCMAVTGDCAMGHLAAPVPASEAANVGSQQPFAWINPHDIKRSKLTDYAESIEVEAASVTFGHCTMPVYLAAPAAPTDAKADAADAGGQTYDATVTLLRKTVDFQHKRISELEARSAAQSVRDAARYQWLKERFTGYDFYWGGKPDAESEEDQGKCVIVFECGQDFRAGRDFEKAIDDALIQSPQAPGKEAKQ